MFKKLSFVDKVLWVPFETRFSELLQQMKENQKLFDDELTLLRTKVSVATYKKLHIEFEQIREYQREDQQKTPFTTQAESCRSC